MAWRGVFQFYLFWACNIEKSTKISHLKITHTKRIDNVNNTTNGWRKNILVLSASNSLGMDSSENGTFFIRLARFFYS